MPGFKALVLAGGRGKRLEGIASNRNKCMLKYNGQPLITYSLINAVKTGVEEIIIIVGYRAEDVINYLGNSFQDTRIRYVIQKEQKGLVDAINCSRETMENADFMTFLGDEILVSPRHQDMIKQFREDPELFVMCGVIEVSDRKEISKTYAIIQDNDSSIYRLIEKPRKPLNNIMGTGNCIFRNEIFDYISFTPINQTRGEKELVDMIQCSIDEGEKVKSFNIGKGYININTEEDLIASETLLKKLKEEENQ